MQVYRRSCEKRGERDIVFATSVSDIWQYPYGWLPPVSLSDGINPYDGKTRAIEISNAVKGYWILDGKLPFSIVPGNHDYDAVAVSD